MKGLKSRRKAVLLSLLLLLIVSCINKDAVTPRGLEGDYQVDLASLPSMVDEDHSNDWALTFLSMAIENTDIKVRFGETTILLDASGFLGNVFKMIVGEHIVFPMVYDYTIKNDSILCVKEQGMSEAEYDEVAIIRKLGETYDYLRLTPLERDSSECEGEKIVLTLRRVE